MNGRSWITMLGITGLLGAGAGQLAAQEATIRGRITNERGEPLGGASVAIANTSFTAATTTTGTYALTVSEGSVRGQQVSLVARYPGYRPSTRTITLSAGTQEQNFQLEPDPLRLEEVIVTGTGEARSATKLTFAVGTVTEQQLQEVPGRTALEAIQGKVSGARVIPTSAQPGGEVSIRLRGATSISGRQDPLIIVDGTITVFGLRDIAPEDIERVEVIKGAAASSLYGSNAANGVVQVFTRRGTNLAEGQLQVTSRVEGGINQMPSRMEFARSHYYQVKPNCTLPDPDGCYVRSPSGARLVEPDQVADNPFPKYNNQWDQIVKDGQYWTAYASIGQRRGGTNFNASFQNTENKGVIVQLGGYSRQNFRLNLDQQIRHNVNASFSTFYGNSTNSRSGEGQDSPFFGLMFVQPDVDLVDAEGNPNPIIPLSGDIANDFNPLYELTNRKIQQDRNRFMGSGRLQWRPREWLTAEGNFAYDQEGQDFSDLQPFGYQTSTGVPLEGYLRKSSTRNRQFNSGVSLTSVRTFGRVVNTSRVFGYYEDQQNRFLESFAGSLKVGDVPEFGSADQSTARVQSNLETFRTYNVSGLTTFDINDRYILDGLIRFDGSSLFGPESRWSTYYRVSGAWRINEDLKIKGIDEFRIRASYGTAGLRPNFAYQYEILQVTPTGFSKETLGNPFLKPARSAELEVGTNLAFGGNRFTLEYNYSKKRTTDQILLVDLPAVAGFKQQWQNTGKLESNTHEASFGARLISSRNTALTLNIVGDRTRNRITEWTLPERLYSFQQMPSTFFLGNNSDLGIMYGNRWVRTLEELLDDPSKTEASLANYMINEDGYVVLKSAYGTINERPVKYVRCKRSAADGTCAETTNIVQIGNGNPKFNMSFGLTFNYKRFGVYGLLDWSQGGQLYNGTRQWAFQALRDRVQDQVGGFADVPAKPENASSCGTSQANPEVGSCPRKAAPYYSVGFYNGLDPNDFFVESGSYAKLKELSVNYTLVRDQLRTIGLGGLNEVRLSFITRNLFRITNYSGLDPEVSGLFGDPFQVRMDWFQYPQFRTFSTVVEIAF